MSPVECVDCRIGGLITIVPLVAASLVVIRVVCVMRTWLCGVVLVGCVGIIVWVGLVVMLGRLCDVCDCRD